jgi:ribonuclease P protein component
VGGAVVRNRLRRQLRAAAVAASKQDRLPSGWYLVIVDPSAAGSDFTTLSGWLFEALGRLPGSPAAGG